MTYRSFVIAAWLFASLASGCHRAAGNAVEIGAITAIRELGGRIEVDEKQSGQPVVKVYLHSTTVKDADLVHIVQLKKVQSLFLAKTQITDEGLEFLREAHSLKTLSLNMTRVTDAGLKHLVGLTNLKTLNLQDTQVTEAGAAELKRKLSRVTIAR